MNDPATFGTDSCHDPRYYSATEPSHPALYLRLIKWYIMKGYYKKLYVRVCKGSYLRVTTNGSAQGISLKSPTLDSQVSV